MKIKRTTIERVSYDFTAKERKLLKKYLSKHDGHVLLREFEFGPSMNGNGETTYLSVYEKETTSPWRRAP